MLLRELANPSEVEGLEGTFHFLTAIALGRRDYYTAVKVLLDYNTNAITDYLKQCSEKNKIKAVVKHLLEDPIFEIRKQKVTLGQATANLTRGKENLRVSTESIIDDVYSLLMDYDQSEYIYLFANTRYCSDCLRSYARKKCYEKTGSFSVSDSTVEAICKDAKEFLKSYSSGFRFKSGDNAIGWVVQSFNFYCMGGYNGRDLYYYLNERNQDAVIGGEANTTALELMAVEDKYTPQSVNFMELTSRIAEASAAMYNHKNGLQAYSDIFTHYNEGKVARLEKKLRANLGKDAEYFIIKNVWNTTINDLSYVVNKKVNRDNVASVMEILLTTNIAENELYRLYRKVLKVDSSTRLSNGVAKDGVRLFTAEDTITKNARPNGEIFKTIYRGYIALREFLEYLEGNGINSLSFSPAIFRDLESPRRYYTLSEYLYTRHDVEQLREDAMLLDNAEKDEVNGIKKNDILYRNICVGFLSGSNILDSYLKTSCTLGDIKVALQNNQAEKEKDNIDSWSVRVYKENEEYLQYLAIGLQLTLQEDGSIRQVARMLLSEEQVKQFSGFVKMSTQDNRYAVMYVGYSKENYIKCLDKANIEETTPEYRERFINLYSLTLTDAEKATIKLGGFGEMSMDNLQSYSSMLSTVLKTHYASGEMKNRKVFLKLCLAYLNCLECLMEQEDHPVSVESFYNLKGLTLKEEFSYMEEYYSEANPAAIQAQMQDRIDCIEICFSYLCGEDEEYDTEWEELHKLFIAKNVLQAYAEKTRAVLASITKADMKLKTYQELQFQTTHNNSYSKFIQDGPFAALLRAAIHDSFICANRDTNVATELPLYYELNVYRLNPIEYRDKAVEVAEESDKFIVRIVKMFYEDFNDIFAFFDHLSKMMLKEFGRTLHNSVVNLDNNEREELIRAASSLRSTVRVLSPEQKELQKTISEKLKKSTVYDDNGYVLVLNDYYKDNNRYLHVSGHWVEISFDSGRAVATSSLVTKEEFSTFMGRILNETF